LVSKNNNKRDSTLQDYTHSKDCFLFSLENSFNKPEKLTLKNSISINSAFNDGNNGPIFGEGPDIFISSNPHINQQSFSKLSSYSSPSYLGFENSNYLAGTLYFTVMEIEVFVIY
jgi:hypothetical protein